ncbi:MAG: Ni-sirohydrochlorin a,c-diamide synthase [Methanobacteriales archaeon HGW-Methanobacteriales-2]|nr:MAG: Ni-sirohydrochlorin a,c-diamide synthase [Methanobacteriales archaeon HGW-Methanobacteriales-2]
MRVVLAGTGSAVGKTTISTGIMKALSREQKVQPFKVGPDYIDPTYHTLATGNVSRNLDSFFMNDGQIREAFERGLGISNSRIGVIEGVRGLYEGISPTGDVGNTASIAKALNAPVILILNSRSLVKSAAAIVIGFKTLDPTIKIEGVILNLVKNRKHYLKTKEAVEKLADTPVIGGIPRDDAISVEQRHLGLVPAVERENIKRNIEDWGRVMEENIDLDALITIMKGAGSLPEGREPLFQQKSARKVKMGIARDEVFTFYYQDNLEALEANQAELVYFSPLHDEELPDVDGIYIGGGYPEVFARELEANHSMRSSVKKFHQEERPIYAECGGLMYLTRSINQHSMCGVFGYNSSMTKKPQALSYVIARASRDNIIIPEGETFHGHEFHYSKLELEGQQPEFAFDILRGRGVVDSRDGLMSKNTLASYVHTHVAACSTFASRLVRAAAGDY